jgi:protein phosphatase
MRHVLTEVVGVRTDMEVEVHECPLEPGDVLLICSDGLHGVLEASHLEAILRASAGSLEAACRDLVEAAKAAGGPDNVTVILLRAPDTMFH